MFIKTSFLFSFLFLGQVSACPTSPYEWDQQQQKFIKLITPKFGDNSKYSRGPKLLPLENYKKVIKFWNKCKNKKYNNLFKNIIKHAKYMYQIQSPGHSGSLINDRDNLINSLSQNMNFGMLPEFFFRNQYLPKDWKKIVQKCKGKNSNTCEKINSWTFFSFFSKLEDGSGHHQRIVIHLTGKEFDQFALFFPNHPEHKNSKLVDIITIEKTEGPKKIHFFEKTIDGFSQDGGRCLTCHNDGLRKIIPLHGSIISPTDLQKNNKLNKIIKSFQKVDLSNHIDFDSVGPAMGASCKKCHFRGGPRNPITLLTKPSLIRAKIDELEMPYSKIYSNYFKSIHSLPNSQDLQFKKDIKKMITSFKAMPGEDYKSQSDIEVIRKKIQGKMLESGHINKFDYCWQRLTEILLSPVSQFKRNHFFSDYQKEFREWLENN